MPSMRRNILLSAISTALLSETVAFSLISSPSARTSTPSRQFRVLYSEKDEREDVIERKSFDEAGKSLIDEQDRERMEQMGDFDESPDYQKARMEQMREAIRARAESLDIEKSKVSADYVAAKTKAAQEAGSASAAEENSDMFGGLDLSQISSEKVGSSDWDEELPNMFYDPEDDLSKEEQEEADPLMTKSFVEQATTEIGSSKWPGPLAALREVALMLVVVVITATIIIAWDQLLRGVYTGFGFIPSADDLTNYATRFDGLDLPSGWTDNMNEDDVAAIADKLNGLSP